MTCTTFLNESELNVPLKNAEIQHILDAVRKVTGENWQVIHHHDYVTGVWPFRKVEPMYGLYVYVGGCGPWQAINFYRDYVKSSINTMASLELVAAYLLGVWSGANTSKEQA